jgi:hypothetical protein
MGRPTNEQVAARMADAEGATTDDADIAVKKYQEAMSRFDPEDPTKLKPVDPAADYVQVRILPNGDGKVSKGIYDKEKNNFPFHKRGDRLSLPRSVAEAQESNGYVEIEADGN